MRDTIRSTINCHRGVLSLSGCVYYGWRGVSGKLEEAFHPPLDDEFFATINAVFNERNFNRSWLRESGVPL